MAFINGMGWDDFFMGWDGFLRRFRDRGMVLGNGLGMGWFWDMVNGMVSGWDGFTNGMGWLLGRFRDGFGVFDGQLYSDTVPLWIEGLTNHNFRYIHGKHLQSIYHLRSLVAAS